MQAKGGIEHTKEQHAGREQVWAWELGRGSVDYGLGRPLEPGARARNAVPKQHASANC